MQYLKNLIKTIIRKFIKRQQNWSIAIYTCVSPFSLSAPNKSSSIVLSAKDATDVLAEFVADPFMVNENGIWYMFFEVLNARTQKGEIGLATSDDVFNWTYKQIVMDESFHLSYPCVFKWNNTYYMIPESHQANSVRLYQSVDKPVYGDQVRAFEITELTTTSYREQAVKENPIIKAGKSGWNSAGMHNVDPWQIDKEKWIACVDGYTQHIKLKYPGKILKL